MQRQRNALVTGSTSGIGLAIATELAARGKIGRASCRERVFKDV